MRAGCIAQDMIVLRPLRTRRGGTSTERLKTGAGQFKRLATPWTRRVLRPTDQGDSHPPSPFRRHAISPIRRFAAPYRTLTAWNLTGGCAI